MSHRDPITSIHSKRIADVCKLRKSRERRSSGCFIAEGMREVTRAVDAGLMLRDAFVANDLLGAADREQLRELFAAHQIEPWDCAVEPFRKMAYRDEPEGVLAVFDQPRWSLDDLPSRADALYLVAEGVQKPGNLGAMARSIAAAGADALLVPDGVVDAFNPNAIRASTGAVFTLPTIAATGDRILTWLRARGVRIVAAHPDGGVPHHAVDLRGPVAIVIGAEDRGLTEVWREAARNHGAIATIAMTQGLVDSLNASNTAAVMLFEAVRQRTGTDQTSPPK